MASPRRSSLVLLLLAAACSSEPGTDLGPAGTGGVSTGSGGSAEGAGGSGSGGDSELGAMGGSPHSGGFGPASGGNASGGADATSGGTASGGGDGAGGTGVGGQPGTGGAQVCDNESPAFSCDMLGTWPTDQASAEELIVELVNEHRALGADCGGQVMPSAPALTMDETLRCAARVHAADMADRDFFSHSTWNPAACSCEDDEDCGDAFMCDGEMSGEEPKHCGKAPGTRVSEIGGSSGAGWENIAAGNDTAEETVEQWMESPGHCLNVMNASLVSIGVGYAKGGTYGHYWVQSFDND